ncbi:MAG: UDP-N-acetylmuramoyl-L-alanyl-D-glutamate--2,6-diaminopimelate ligase [Candidatus Bipolaricaulia bacterium]
MKRELKELLSEIPYLAMNGKDEQLVTGIYHDSRAVRPGGLFVAIPGKQTDGHEYISEAIENGARVVFGEIPFSEVEPGPETYVRVRDSRKSLSRISHVFYGKPTKKLFVAGITGTNGKTTTAHLTAHLLGKYTDSITTLTRSDSNPEKEPVTTPEAPVIHEIAHEDLHQGVKNLVMEVSSHGLSMDRVSQVDFDCGVFTNLTRDHLDFYESMKDYAAEKLKLFSYLSEDSTAIVNSDEELSTKIGQKTEADVLKYGIREPAEIVAEKINKSTRGVEFRINSPWGTETVKLSFPGLYNVYNALAAVSVGLTRGKDFSRIIRRLETAERLSGRLEEINLNNGSDVYIDFAHNPGALESTLKELQDHYDKVLLVFGCGGMSDRGKRPEMGEVATVYADRFFLTDDNPKKEDRHKILREIEQGVGTTADYESIPNRKTAIETAIEELTRDSCLLVAGKGHESYQIVSGNLIEYNDTEFVKETAKEKGLI